MKDVVFRQNQLPRNGKFPSFSWKQRAAIGQIKISIAGMDVGDLAKGAFDRFDQADFSRHPPRIQVSNDPSHSAFRGLVFHWERTRRIRLLSPSDLRRSGD